MTSTADLGVKGIIDGFGRQPSPGGCDPDKVTCAKLPCSEASKSLGTCKGGPEGTRPVTPDSPGGGSGAGTAPGGSETTGPGQCPIKADGSPDCGGSGVASQGDTKAAQGVGNPINLITGNKYQEETDLPALPGVLGLELKRYYNSQSSYAGLTGASWRSSYETILYDVGNQIQIIQADGRRMMFDRGVGDGALLCTSPHPQDGQVRIEEPRDGRGQRTYRWRWPDGRTLVFGNGNNGGHRLQRIVAAGGQTLSIDYSRRGDITQITDPQGRKLVVIYEDDTQRSGGLTRIRAIDTPFARISYTRDKRGNLIEVSQNKRLKDDGVSTTPQAMRLYHYEAAHNGGNVFALTGISERVVDEKTRKTIEQRLSTYVYNAAGRAILSTKGRPREVKDGKPVAGTGIEQVELQFVDKALPIEGQADRVSGEVQPRQLGKTIITNSLGQKTEARFAVIGGHGVLVEMRGPGCSTCGPGNMRYAYNTAGQMLRETRLDSDGIPVASRVTRYDDFGRISKVGRQIHDKTGAKAGVNKAAETEWLRRFEYADTVYQDGSVAVAPKPSVIAQPSVVSGKEHTLHVEYNEMWEPTRVSESGFSPLGADDKPTPAGTPIGRTSTYRYAKVNGITVLVEIDGPLANGPKNSPEDSDITRIQWDAKGHQIVGITFPMMLTAKYEFGDDTGRPTAATGPDGMTHLYQWGPAGELIAVTRRYGEHELGRVSYRYDAHHRVVETFAGTSEAPVPTSRQEFDIAGRLLWQASSLGILRQARYDSEDKLLESSVIGAGIRQEERYTYDTFGRLERVEDNTGATHRLVHDAAGRITATIDPLGRVTEYVQDREAHAWQVTEAANTYKPLSVRYGLDPNGSVNEVSAQAGDAAEFGNRQRSITTHLLKDDFGQEVAVVSPDSATVLKRYDAGGQIIQIEDAMGTVTDIAYDAAGRMIRRTVTPRATRGPQAGGIPSQAATPQTTLFVYEGMRLVEVRNARQSERFAYDDLGRVASKTVRLTLIGGQQATSVARYRYDEQGRLAAQTLPDGSELQYERNGQGQIVALSRQAGAWAPFGWGRKTLVTGLERDLVGLRSATYGNGVVGQRQRSQEGVLARVVYTSPVRSGGALQTAFESMVPDAHAQANSHTPAQAPPAGQPASSPLPGAYGVPPEPRALWDSRLLFDAAGNILMQGQFGSGTVARPGQTSYAYDGLNQLAQAVHTGIPNGEARSLIDTVSDDKAGTVWRYHHDSLGNRLLAQEQQPGADMGHTVKSSPHSGGEAEPLMDAVGQPLAGRERNYEWDAEGQLVQISQPGKPTASYRYDHRGLRVSKQVGDAAEHYLYDERRQRLAELDAQGRITREYVWMGDQLIAVIDPQQLRTPEAPADGFVQKLGSTARALWAYVSGNEAALNYVHANHLGAPVVMTDKNAQPVWSAEYAPFGKRIAGQSNIGIVKTAAPGHVPQAGVHGIKLDLRLPGQWEDAESGLHYNDQRYYDPNKGRYLSPDPLGLQGGLNAHAYVGNNPVGFSDPMGLVLFAFDGTGNTDPPWPGDTVTNVVKFRGLYESDRGVVSKNFYYITGVGTVDSSDPARPIRPTDFVPKKYKFAPVTMDMAGNFSGPARIGRMIEYFDAAADAYNDAQVMNIDIIGFSRGAAQARDFANRIVAKTSNGIYQYRDARGGTHCQKVNFRFLGLWDSVLSTNETGYTYNLAIPDVFANVAHAVALNEHRGAADSLGMGRTLPGSYGNFPLESILRDAKSTVPVAGKTRIERGFLGAHADIGGAYAANQLSAVALDWMVQQAKDAGVSMGDSAELHEIVANPVLHDESDTQYTRDSMKGNLDKEDREVRYRDGTTTTARKKADEGLTYLDTLSFIKFNPGVVTPGATIARKPADHSTGTVDMAGYLNWLREHGYGLGDLHVK